MKIAFLTPYLPYPPDTGGKIRTFHLLKGLSRAHEIDLYTVHYGPQANTGNELPAICRHIFDLPLQKSPNTRSRLVRCFTETLPRVIDHFYSPEVDAEFLKHLETEQYDLFAVDEICMAPYVSGLQGQKIVLRQKIDFLHYLEVASKQPVGKERMLQTAEAVKLRRYEERTMEQFHAAVCCSEEDAKAVNRRNTSIPVTVIGNGVDLEYFSTQAERPVPPTLLYTGTMHYYPNIDAVQFFFEDIYPHLASRVQDLRVLIVGHQPPPEILSYQKLPGVTITGSVPDVRPYLADCTATMVPLRLGGGTRLKIMESIAAGRAVISTTVGAEGVGMRHREHLLVADEPAAFAEQAAELLGDSELRQRLVRQARPLVEERFSWDVLGHRFEAACREAARKAIH